jgi:hypothetical protein
MGLSNHPFLFAILALIFSVALAVIALFVSALVYAHIPNAERLTDTQAGMLYLSVGALLAIPLMIVWMRVLK